jgi:hypothetical protein
MITGFVNFLIRLDLRTRGNRAWRSFLRITEEPERIQRELLQSILSKNRDTVFGREHGFDGISSPSEYADKVPVSDYEALRPYIERQEYEGTSELLEKAPILYARTSGSTGAPKLIPITRGTFARHRLNQRIFACCHATAMPGIFEGSILAFVSPPIEGELATGTPFGSMSGMIYSSMPRLLRRKYLLPVEIFSLPDHDLKYLLIAIFSVADRSVTYAAAANPSSFTKLEQVIRSNADRIAKAVETGELPGHECLDDEAGHRIRARFRRDESRARELREIFAGGGNRIFAALWPRLKAVSCWREGSCRVLLPGLRKHLPEGLPILETGYLASEFRGSLPVSSLDHREVPTFHENYFEFMKRSDREAGRQETCTLGEVEPGIAYYVIVTTQDGLYRYFINDLVEVTGFFNKTPTIRFLEKGAGVTNITGEKLYESQVTSAVEKLARKRNGFPDFFLMVADAERQRYVFHFERHGEINEGFAAELDEELACLNIEYEAKRASGRLGPIELRALETGTGEAYKNHFVSAGQRESQFKFLRLVSREKLGYDLDKHRIPPA